MAKPSATTVFVLILWALATTLVVTIVAPFAGPLFAAAVIAGVLHPAQLWLSRRLGDRPLLAAGALTCGAILAVVAPLTILGIQGSEQIARGFGEVQRVVETDGLDGAIATLPPPLQAPAQSLAKRLPFDLWSAGEDGAAGLSQARGLDLAAVARWVGRGLSLLMDLVVDVGVLVLALYFMLARGRDLVEWVAEMAPLSDEQSDELIGRIRDVNRAVFVATIGSALVQTVLAGIGFFIADVPWLPAALLLTFLAALLPVVGGAVIVVAAGALVWMQGSFGYGIFLVVWGVVVVGLADNIVKPFMAERTMQLPSSLIFFAMLGGISVFGPMGIVAGPLVLAFFITILGLMRNQGWGRA